MKFLNDLFNIDFKKLCLIIVLLCIIKIMIFTLLGLNFNKSQINNVVDAYQRLPFNVDSVKNVHVDKINAKSRFRIIVSFDKNFLSDEDIRKSLLDSGYGYNLDYKRFYKGNIDIYITELDNEYALEISCRKYIFGK